VVHFFVKTAKRVSFQLMNGVAYL